MDKHSSSFNSDITIKLSTKETILLCQCLVSPQPYTKHQMCFQLILQNEKVLDQLRDEIANILCKKGVDSSGEINSLGLSLENLIDKLNNVLFKMGEV